jgi:hypothetical protein
MICYNNLLGAAPRRPRCAWLAASPLRCGARCSLGHALLLPAAALRQQAAAERVCHSAPLHIASPRARRKSARFKSQTSQLSDYPSAR